MRRKSFSCLFLLVTLAMCGCEVVPVDSSFSGGSDDTASVENSSDEAYALRSGDPLFIRFSGVMDQQQVETTIDENGEISLLHLPSIKAVGLTTSKLEQEIETQYITNKIYNTLSVHVTMTAMVYYIQGNVNSPGEYPLRSGTTLLQAIAGARGLDMYAGKKVTITRHGKVLTFNIKKLEKDPSKDIRIEAGDVIKVWQSLI